MASIINASTSSGIVQTADTSGVLAIQSAGTTVATFNSSGVNAGIQVAANAAPAFSYYADGTTQTFTNATYTKVLFQVKEFDTNSNFASSRFTPTVAGYYQVNAQLLFPALAGLTCLVAVYKNGSDFKEGTRTAIAALSSGAVNVSALVYCNGSTDYIEIYGQQASGSSQNLAGTNNQFLNYFQASMVRSA
jgi:hypothetical protein